MTRQRLGLKTSLLSLGILLAFAAPVSATSSIQASPAPSPRDQIKAIIAAKKAGIESEKARLQRFREFHFPIVEGKRVAPIPYLTLPFRSADLDGQYDVTEGWIYSEAEKSIHGITMHNGVDFSLPYGTPVVAPADGYAMSSYQTYTLQDDNGPMSYQGHPLRIGLGNFVQIYVPEVNRFVQMGHLSDVDPAIPFSIPTANGDGWAPVNHNLTIPELKNHPQVVKVKKGQLIGKVGWSGQAMGYQDYHAGAQRPVITDPATQKSWDEPHIHFEDFYRDQTTRLKITNRDPYGIYSTTNDYPTPIRDGKLMRAPLFHRGIDGLPQFAH